MSVVRERVGEARKPKRRVVHVIGSLAAGGAEVFVASLAEALVAEGVQVTVIALSGRLDVVGERMRDTLNSVGVKCYVGPTKRIGIASVIWYFRLVRRLSFDIVHLHTPNTELIHWLSFVQMQDRVKLFRTVHSMKVPESCFVRCVYRWNKADRSIACSSAVAQANRWLIADNVVVICNGVSFPFPIRDATLSIEYKKRLGWDARRFHFLQVGSLNGVDLESNAKAHDVVLRAWQLGEFGKRGCVLHVVGDGNLRCALEALVAGDQSVEFCGVCVDVGDRLVAADCFLMPSRYEGLPIAGIEAVGAGVPFVFSDIAPLRELGRAEGIWVRPNSAEDLSLCMIRVLTDKTESPRESVLAFRSQWSIESVAHQYMEQYRSVS